MRVKIRGKRWTIVNTNHLAPDADAQCDPPTLTNKQIKIRPKLKEARYLEMVIHECLHAAFWDLDEAAIEETAEDFTRILWRLGYRKMDNRPTRAK